METIIIWAVIAWLVMRWIDIRAKDYARARQQILQERLQDQPVRLSVEQMGDMLYCWDAATKDFVCQGRNIEELRQNFSLRYPNRNAAIAQGPEDLIDALRQQLQTLKQNDQLVSSKLTGN